MTQENIYSGMPASIVKRLQGFKGLSGKASGATTTTITDDKKNLTADAFANKLISVDIDGIEYIRTITSNTNNEFTFPTLGEPGQAELVIGAVEAGQVTVVVDEPGIAGNVYRVILTDDAYAALTEAVILGNTITVTLETDAGTKSTATVITTGEGEISIVAPVAGVIGDTYSVVVYENQMPEENTTAIFEDGVLTIGLKIDEGVLSSVSFGTGLTGNGTIDIVSSEDYTVANTYTLVIEQGVGLSLPTTAAFDTGVLTITLGTDAASQPNATVADAVAAVLLVPNFTASITVAGAMETTAGVPFGAGRGPEVIALTSDVKTAVELTTDFTVDVTLAGLMAGQEAPIPFTGGVNPVSIATATDVANAINGIDGFTATMTGAGGVMASTELLSLSGGYEGNIPTVGTTYSLIL